MKVPLNRLVFVLGTAILALMAIDGLVQLNQSALSQYGFGESSWVAADSAAALFLVGLIAGMVLGIGIFFGYLMYREKKYAEEPDEVGVLLNEISMDLDEDEPLFLEENHAEERAEKLDPWERPADWWKSEDE